MFNSLATCLAISFPFVPCSLEIAITKLFVIFSFLIGLILSLYDFFKIISETITVNNSEIGNVHQTSVVTFSVKVKKYAIGNTKITKRSKAIIKGLIA